MYDCYYNKLIYVHGTFITSLTMITQVVPPAGAFIGTKEIYIVE